MSDKTLLAQKLIAPRERARDLDTVLPAGRLATLPEFGANPGALRGYVYVPVNLAKRAALVVVLHGCGQTAGDYAEQAGWIEMAEQQGFVVLCPQQRRMNNFTRCFNWFAAEDSHRGEGEVVSIREMIDTLTATVPIDAAKVFVTGLSAGGAMAQAMLASYPEVFAGGAIIAGLPFGCAQTVGQGLELMRGRGIPGDDDLGALVRSAAPNPRSWPVISVWQGTADTTVSPVNAEAIVTQWRAVHAIAAEPQHSERVDGYPRRVWCDARGRPVIEAYTITDMGHGTPLATTGEDRCGKPGPFMLEAGISSTRHICRFWGLIAGRDGQDGPVQAERPDLATVATAFATSVGDVLSGLTPTAAPARRRDRLGAMLSAIIRRH